MNANALDSSMYVIYALKKIIQTDRRVHVRCRSLIYSLTDRAFFAGGISLPACKRSSKTACSRFRLWKSACRSVSSTVRCARSRTKLCTCNTFHSASAEFTMDKTTPGSAVLLWLQPACAAHTNANKIKQQTLRELQSKATDLHCVLIIPLFSGSLTRVPVTLFFRVTLRKF